MPCKSRSALFPSMYVANAEQGITLIHDKTITCCRIGGIKRGYCWSGTISWLCGAGGGAEAGCRGGQAEAGGDEEKGRGCCNAQVGPSLFPDMT